MLINTRLVALISNHDAVAAEPEKLEAAAAVYRDLLASVGCVSRSNCVMVYEEWVWRRWRRCGALG